MRQFFLYIGQQATQKSDLWEKQQMVSKTYHCFSSLPKEYPAYKIGKET